MRKILNLHGTDLEQALSMDIKSEQVHIKKYKPKGNCKK